MLPVERRTATIDLLASKRAVSVESLAEHLAVSLSTVRRDLDELEREGVVRRVHGGAVLQRPDAPPDAPELPPATRQIEHSDAKHAIARRAVELVQPGSALLVTGGTTTAALAPLLAGVPDITVVTNSLDVAVRLAHLDVDLVLLGGALRRPELSLLGSLVGLGLDELHVDHAIMGVYGIDPRSGLLGASAVECETDRRLARSAGRLTVLADASKFTRRSPHRITTLDAVSELVTTADAPAAEVAALREQGLDVHLA
jgi:DeoR/GlpR family transcriptional regulator of sugar metabolism